MGLPVGTGAAVACPDRKVICLEGDRSDIYHDRFAEGIATPGPFLVEVML